MIARGNSIDALPQITTAVGGQRWDIGRPMFCINKNQTAVDIFSETTSGVTHFLCLTMDFI